MQNTVNSSVYQITHPFDDSATNPPPNYVVGVNSITKQVRMAPNNSAAGGSSSNLTSYQSSVAVNTLQYPSATPSHYQASVPINTAQNSALVHTPPANQVHPLMQSQVPGQSQSSQQVQAQYSSQMQAPVSNQALQLPQHPIVPLMQMTNPNSVQNLARSQAAMYSVNHQLVSNSNYPNISSDINHQVYSSQNNQYFSLQHHNTHVKQNSGVNSQNINLFQHQMTAAPAPSMSLSQNVQAIHANVNQYQVSQPSVAVSQSATAATHTGVNQALTPTFSNSSNINLTGQSSINNSAVNLTKNSGNEVQVVVQNLTIENQVSVPVDPAQKPVVRTQATTFDQQVSVIQSQTSDNNQTTIRTQTSAVSNQVPVVNNKVPVINNISIVDSQVNVSSQAPALFQSQTLTIQSQSTVIDNPPLAQNNILTNNVIINNETQVANNKSNGGEQQQDRPVILWCIALAQIDNSTAQVQNSVSNNTTPAVTQDSSVKSKPLVNEGDKNLNKQAENSSLKANLPETCEEMEVNESPAPAAVTKSSEDSQNLTNKIPDEPATAVPANSKEKFYERLPLKKRLNQDYSTQQSSPTKKSRDQIEANQVTSNHELVSIDSTEIISANKEDLIKISQDKNEDRCSSISKDKVTDENSKAKGIEHRPVVLNIIPENELVLLSGSDEDTNNEIGEETATNIDQIEKLVVDFIQNKEEMLLGNEEILNIEANSADKGKNQPDLLQQELDVENEVSSSTEISPVNSRTSLDATKKVDAETDVSTSFDDKVAGCKSKLIELVTLDSDEESDDEANIETEVEDNDGSDGNDGNDDSSDNKSHSTVPATPLKTDPEEEQAEEMEVEQFKYTQSSIDEEIDCVAIANNSSVVENSAVDNNEDDDVDNQESSIPLIMGVCSITEDAFETIDKSVAEVMMEDIVDVTDQEKNNVGEDIIKLE